MLWFYTKKQIDERMNYFDKTVTSLSRSIYSQSKDLENINTRMMELFNDLNNQLKTVMETQKELASKCELLKENIIFLKGQITGKGKK
jgi:archaellum component FlaC